MVSAASRMFSAISFGVFCRFAPSTRAIIRSMKLSPGFWVIRTTIRSESTLVPPVTARAVAAGLADHRRRLAGDRRLVDAGDALDDVAVAGDRSRPASTTTRSPCRRSRGRAPAPRRAPVAPASSRPGGGRRCPSRARRSASACALPRPSATASARLAKTHGQPQPDGDRPGEHGRVGDRQHGGEDRADLDDEHDRVAPQRARVELAQRVGQRRRAAAWGRAARRRPAAAARALRPVGAPRREPGGRGRS